MEVKANNIADFDDMKNPGDFVFTFNAAGDICGMIEKCPCGCGAEGGISFATPSGERGGPKWTWNGETEKISLTPSIQRTTGCKWHGYLTDGVFKSC